MGSRSEFAEENCKDFLLVWQANYCSITDKSYLSSSQFWSNCLTSFNPMYSSLRVVFVSLYCRKQGVWIFKSGRWYIFYDSLAYLYVLFVAYTPVMFMHVPSAYKKGSGVSFSFLWHKSFALYSSSITLVLTINRIEYHCDIRNTSVYLIKA